MLARNMQVMHHLGQCNTNVFMERRSHKQISAMFTMHQRGISSLRECGTVML
jgi:hypothetical protein